MIEVLPTPAAPMTTSLKWLSPGRRFVLPWPVGTALLELARLRTESEWRMACMGLDD